MFSLFFFFMWHLSQVEEEASHTITVFPNKIMSQWIIATATAIVVLVISLITCLNLPLELRSTIDQLLKEAQLNFFPIETP